MLSARAVSIDDALALRPQPRTRWPGLLADATLPG